VILCIIEIQRLPKRAVPRGVHDDDAAVNAFTDCKWTGSGDIIDFDPSNAVDRNGAILEHDLGSETSDDGTLSVECTDHAPINVGMCISVPTEMDMNLTSPMEDPTSSPYQNSIFGSSSSSHLFGELGTEGTFGQVLDLEESLWCQIWSLHMMLDGVQCTKIARNGKPYERRMYVDTQNRNVEIRGGRKPTVIFLDDMTEFRTKLCSAEFFKFCNLFRKQVVPAALSRKAVVMQTRVRSFSLIFKSTLARDALAQLMQVLKPLKITFP